MPTAVEFLERLEREHVSTTIDWETVLARQYAAVLASPRTVVDVGANEGLHTRRLIALGARRVVCIEPMPDVARRLREEFGPAIEVHNAALSSRPGRQEFHLNLDIPTHSGLRQRVDTAPGTRLLTIAVETLTLDSLGLTEVDFLKLDCEGGDLDVLAGGEATIAASRPLVSIEYGAAGYLAYGHTHFSLWDWAVGHDYVVADLFGHALDTREVYDACVDRYYWDYFLAPRGGGHLEALRAAAPAIFREMSPFAPVG